MVETNPVVKVRTENIQVVQVKPFVNTVASHIHGEIVQHMGRSAKSVAKTITLRLYAEVMLILINVTQDAQDPKKARVREKSSMKWLKIKMRWKIFADQVQSLFYHDIHFNSVDTGMHTKLGCEDASWFENQ